MTYPKGYRPPPPSKTKIRNSRFSRKNFKRAMYHPTLDETLIGMGIAFSLLSIMTFYWPFDDSNRWLGDAIVYLASETGVPQYIICLTGALFFFGLVIYSKLRSRFRKVLPQE